MCTPEEIVDRHAVMRRLDERLQRLDLPSRQLVLLALEGCSTAEIAEVTGLSAPDITTRLSRLRTRLASEEVPS